MFHTPVTIFHTPSALGCANCWPLLVQLAQQRLGSGVNPQLQFMIQRDET
jgi:hypothetical protein